MKLGRGRRLIAWSLARKYSRIAQSHAIKRSNSVHSSGLVRGGMSCTSDIASSTALILSAPAGDRKLILTLPYPSRAADASATPGQRVPACSGLPSPFPYAIAPATAGPVGRVADRVRYQ